MEVSYQLSKAYEYLLSLDNKQLKGIEQVATRLKLGLFRSILHLLNFLQKTPTLHFVPS